MSAAYDVLVLGAGAVGLSTALALRQRGQRVAVLDRRAPARESSWAGGGILSPLYPWRYPQAVSELAAASQRYYREHHERWRRETGIDLQWRQSGLWVGLDDASERDSARRWADALGVALEADVRLADGPDAQWLGLPEVAQLRTPRLGPVLDQLCAGAKVERLYQLGPARLERQGDDFCVLGEAGPVAVGRRAVVCAGAWSGQVLAGFGVDLPVRPVRGQMLLFDAPDVQLRHIRLHRQRYVIPRVDGKILVGSTLEDVEFDCSTTTEAADALRAAAVALVPALKGRREVNHWAGLRPGSPRLEPWVGPVASVPGLFVNTGHHRNGIVLAPGSAAVVADLVCGERPIIDAAPFALSP